VVIRIAKSFGKTTAGPYIILYIKVNSKGPTVKAKNGKKICKYFFHFVTGQYFYICNETHEWENTSIDKNQI
jgi:hypothetical protein